MKYIRSWLLYCIFCLNLSYASINTNTVTTPNQPPGIKNFATSQTPGPFYSFGQFLVNKGQAQLYVYPNITKNENQQYNSVNLYGVYGLTDHASILFNIPIAAYYSVGDRHTTGFADLSLDGEYAYYNKSNSEYESQATIIGSISFPTGSPYRTPTTGNGKNTYFIGHTYHLTTINWYFFLSPGILFSEAFDQFKVGNQYLYQGGIGHNIHSVPKKYIFAFLMELDGQYNGHATVFNRTIRSSGGNILLATPSLWFSTETFTAQLGFAYPITQSSNNDFERINYFTGLQLIWNLN